ncbi:MAG: PBP1A family penicillin-binding protein [Kofleriaceae bacterium]
MQRNVTTRTKRGGAHVARLVLLLGLVVAALGVATVAGVFWVYGRDKNLPDIQKLGDYRPKQVSVILDANGQRIGELFEERRTFVPYEQIPPIVVDSFIAAEDQHFWTHAGIDYLGMLRAFVANLRSGKTKQGASTITQQVVKTFLLTPERTFRRKIQEVILARRLEASLSKQEIMALYLNQIYFGHNRYGVQEAARFYFGKDVGKLDIGEAAMLGGLPQSPENISPRKNPRRAKERQTYVLNQLALGGKLSREEAQKWIDAPIKIVKQPFTELGSAPEWVDLVRRELVAKRGEADLASLGAVVKTTVDPKVQKLAQTALRHGLWAADKRLKVGGKVRAVGAAGVDAEVARLKKRLPKGGPSAKEFYDAVVTAVGDRELQVDLGGWPATLALPTGPRFQRPADAAPRGKKGADKEPPPDVAARDRFAVGDVVKVVLAARAADGDEAEPEAAEDDDEPAAKAGGEAKHGNRVAFAPGPEGAVVVIDLRTRKVRALVGGFASKIAGFNRATMAKRQPGSSFKPFVFAAAIDRGKATGARIINDAPAVYDLASNAVWKPKNYATGKYEGPILARRALARSINTVAIQLCYDVGPDAVAELAERMGITSPLPHEMSLALGSGEVTPLELTNAIATLGAQGQAAAPRFIESIDGTPEPEAAPREALRPEVAYVVLDMMRSVVQEGTATVARSVGPYVAGKTGTSNDARDTWFVGVTSDYAIGVWIGYDDPREMKGETGGHTAAPVFAELAKGMGIGGKPFQRPANVIDASIDRRTGLLAPPDAPKESFYTEVFVSGTAPTEIAPMPDETTTETVVTGEYED